MHESEKFYSTMNQLSISAQKTERTLNVILKRSTGNEELRSSRETEQCLVKLRVGVLQSVRLVNSDVLPLERTKIESILQRKLVRREENVEFEFL